MRTLFAALVIASLSGCAHSAGLEGADGARKTAEKFFRDARWNDWVGASELVVPDRRQDFLAARRQDGQGDFSIVDYEIEQINLSKDTTRGKVIARLSWTRLPSLSVHTRQVVAEMVQKGDHWLVTRLDRGPFPALTGAAPAPASPPSASDASP